jgi:ribonuclease R
MAKLDKIKRKVEQVFAENQRKLLNYKQIASKLELTSTEDKNDIILAIKQLVKAGAIEEVQVGKFAAVFTAQFIEGVVDMTQRGAAYVKPFDTEKGDDSKDIFIQKENVNTALHGDKVKVQLLASKNNGKNTGEIIEIVRRDKTDFVGTIQVSHNYAFLVADDKRMYTDIFIPKEKINKAKNGEKVIVRITSWMPHDDNPTGEVIEILGKPGDHNTEMNAIVAEFGFANKFSDVVEKEANQISDKITKEEIAKRKDFRKTLTFTIDPADAKDFDDAISFKEIQPGLYEIGVHIADVSHYVVPKSHLNDEAYNRGTSVYLVDRTIPMLPEKLSNGLCSLRPNEEKLTFSAVFTIDDKAQVKSEWFGKTVIYSDRRFSYEEAQERIESAEGDYADEIILLNNLAKQMREERFKEGAISFETEEVKFKLDENYKPIDLYIKVRKDAHKLIEEFMLLANKKVAEYVSKMGKGTQKYTYVYRVHESPNEDKLKLFGMFAARFGYNVSLDNPNKVSKSLNNFLIEVEGKPEQNLLQSQAIRTMSKAFYSTKKSGHYGLAFEHYSHFTSPIRRYPDLLAHRLLFNYLNGEKSAQQEVYEEMCKHASSMEQKASDAERASIKYKQVEYIRDFIGESFDGIISGVTEWGMYIEITKYRCEGLIRLSNIQDDYYEYDEKNLCIIGRSTRKKYQLGDLVKVRVVAADIIKRQIDLEMEGDAMIKEVRKNQQRFKKEKERSKGGKKRKRR